MELARDLKTGIDISSEAEVLSYLCPIARNIIFRVSLGGPGQLIVGGGDYIVRIYASGVRMVPENTIAVPTGVTKALVSSRPVYVDAGETVSIRIVGRPGDTVVTVGCIASDATPASVTDFSGSGSVTVDHDYGGTDNLAYKTSEGVGIDNAEIFVYLKADYDANLRTPDKAKARTTTNVSGRWTRALLLDPAAYVLVYFKEGAYGPTALELTVT